MASSLRSRQVALLGDSIHYREGGEGPRVVFVHGWIESSWCWLSVMERLEQSFRVTAVDLLGFGQSTLGEGQPEDYTVERNTSMVEAFLEHEVGEPAHLVGHSMGGMIALSIAARRPELVRSLTMMSSPVDGPNAVARLLQLLELPVVRDSTFRLLRSRNVARFLSNYFVYRATVPDQMVEDAMAVSHAALFGSARSIINTSLVRELGRVRCPSLVLFGDKDRVVDTSQGALAADRLRDAEFRILRATGHCPHIEETRQVTQALRDFLRETSGIPPQLMGVTF